MQIQIKHKAKASWPETDYIKKAARWGAHQLKLQGIDIIIRLVGPHPIEFGSCSMMDETRYIIWLHSGLSRKRTLSTLFHELTHVQQHCYAGLELITNKKARWKSETYLDFDYWYAPWEKEARKMERILYNRYINANI